MRDNQPVTQQEFIIADTATLMSTTDTQSRINYANAAFVEVSGFTLDELQGQPHNLVRHPDMPAEAFADMWSTLIAGEPWTALVKNRRKNGDHYWVRANATPVVRDGRLAGYMSVRTKPSPEEVATAQALYSNIRQGRANGRHFHKGLVVRKDWLAWTSWHQTMPVRWRIRTTLGGMVSATALVAWMLGVTGAPFAALSAFAAMASFLAALLLEVQIARPLAHMRDEALKVATGASHNTSHMNRVDEIGMTMRTVGQLGLMFRWLIDDVSAQVVNLQTAINEIAQGNNDLASRTEQAAASVQETASAMTQMTASVKSSAETANQANQLSSSASEAAAKGGSAVAQVVDTMSRITDSSKKIADIIGVIDGIAFQTNILALNAAVEAARAGEEGRGFAVVAGEVRSLARRSADAAKEIKSLIGSSVVNVESGSRMVDDAGRTMDDIVSQVRRVSDLIGEISSATTEQTTGIGQVGQAIGHLDQITQQNAALVEQSAAASESLKLQATRLVEAVSVFR